MLTLQCGPTSQKLLPAALQFFAIDQKRSSVSLSVGASISRLFFDAVTVGLYGCATLAGLPRQLLDRLQSVFHAAARLIFASRRHDHVTPLLCSLHRLRAPERITFRLSPVHISNNVEATFDLLPSVDRAKRYSHFTCAFTARHPPTSLMSCFRSQETVDISGYTIIANDVPSHSACQPRHTWTTRFCCFIHVGVERYITIDPAVHQQRNAVSFINTLSSE